MNDVFFNKLWHAIYLYSSAWWHLHHFRCIFGLVHVSIEIFFSFKYFFSVRNEKKQFKSVCANLFFLFTFFCFVLSSLHYIYLTLTGKIINWHNIGTEYRYESIVTLNNTISYYIHCMYVLQCIFLVQIIQSSIKFKYQLDKMPHTQH